ncbi:hypothetical protein ACMAY8_11095 [Rhodobacteraceae bacterium nBUS_22]
MSWSIYLPIFLNRFILRHIAEEKYEAMAIYRWAMLETSTDAPVQ